VGPSVEEFAADGADEAFGDRVRPWRAHRRLDDLDVDGGEYGVEGGGELAVMVADEESEQLVGIVQVHDQVARLLAEPRCGRVRGDAEDVDASAGVFDDEERVEPLQGDGVEVEQVASQVRLGLRVKELGPGGPGPTRRRVDARRVENLPHGGGTDLVAESDKFSMHAAISPGGILGGQAHGEGADAGGDGRAACPHGRGGPLSADELTVPAQDRCRGDQESRRRRAGSSLVSAAITARSLQLSRGRGVRRCRTAS
jgi:hypothetical protein